MDQHISQSIEQTTVLDEIREEIALVQVLELNDHCNAYDEIHIKLEEALRAIDGI